MLFRAGKTITDIDVTENTVEVRTTDEVETTSGWKSALQINVGDILSDRKEFAQVTDVTVLDKIVKIVLKEVVS